MSTVKMQNVAVIFRSDNTLTFYL